MLNWLRKLPRFLITGTLTIGVSLMLGLLSFGGMYAIWPLWPVALLSFALSSIYEGEIYIRNIKGAFKKLFSPHNQLQQKLAKQCLLEILSTYPENSPQFPAFCHDYIKLHRRKDQLTKAGATHHTLEDIEQEILAAEVWFSKQLFRKSGKKTSYAQGVIHWLDTQHAQEQTQFQQLLKKRQRARNLAAGFSFVLSSTFMGIGTVYLLSETFAVIPLLATLSLSVTPFAIVPLAVFAGIAYGLLTYHTITDMIERNTFKKMADIFHAPWKNNLSSKERAKKILLCIAVIALILLAGALTICTAGTWWTVAKQVHPLLPRLSNICRAIFAGATAVVNGLSSLAFNWQNTMESVEGITHHDEAPHAHHSLRDHLSELWQALRQRENLWQIFNPFRLLLFVTIEPLRRILFVGHVVSIGVTSDRIPKVNMFVSALLGSFSEMIEDWHYFFGHDHHHAHATSQNPTNRELLEQHLHEEEHGHDHSLDLPTRIIKIAFSPLYLLAKSWDWCATRYHPMPAAPSHQHAAPSITNNSAHDTLSVQWTKERILQRLQSFEKEHFRLAYKQASVIQQKKQIFANLQDNLIAVESPILIKQALDNAANIPVIKTHRFGLFSTGQSTASQKFLESEIGLAAGL